MPCPPGVDCRRSVREGTRRHGNLEHGAEETTTGVRSRSATVRGHAEPGPSRRAKVPPPAVAGGDRLTVHGERSHPTDDTGPDEPFASSGRASGRVDHRRRTSTARRRAHARTIAPQSATEHVSLRTHYRSAPMPGPSGHEGPGRSAVPQDPGGSRSTHRRRGLLWSASLDGRRRRSSASHQQLGDLLRATSGGAHEFAPAISAPSCPACTAESSTSGLGVTREAFHVKRRLGVRLNLADHPTHLPVGDRASGTPGRVTPDVPLIT